MTISQFPLPEGGIPTGNTAGRPASPSIGDVYYNGQIEILEIYNGTSWVACSAPPSTPQIVSVTDASTTDAYTSTAGKLTVVMQAGSGGGTPTQYNAYTTAGGHSASSSSSTVTITGLTPGTSYTVYGNAQNNFGTTVNTANAAAVTPSTLPEVRTNVAASTSSTTTDVTVTWTNGSNGGKNLTSITITPFLNGTTAQTAQTAATTSSTSHTFTGLTPGSSYTFKVKATNANGTCADSTASDSVTIPVIVTYLVIAGGGGGGAPGGGGGAGGYRTGSMGISLSTNYTVTVGAGGAAVNSVSMGNKGSNSVFSNITSTGGGRGLAYVTSGGSGGSGGGGSRDGSQSGGLGNEGNYTPAEGTNGGTTSGGAYRGGSGGGGASVGGAAGGGNGTANGEFGGDGGSGSASSITGSSVTRAGGGGGGVEGSGATPGGGGSGGGGAGGKAATAGSAGTANTGGGGGGGNNTSGAGGSGVVILRWTTSVASITVGAGLTADATGTDGSFSYKVFTAGTGNVSWS